MSLLGRLEDLSLTDIIQIVFLSRRTGMLEIVDSSGRSMILFHHGLVIDARNPSNPDLLAHLRQGGVINDAIMTELERMTDEGVSAGTALIELGVVGQDALSAAARARILEVVAPLLESREGEFNFILSEGINAFELQYDPDSLFRDGGISAQQILGGGEGEKLKPLRGLEETMKVGKALLGRAEEGTAAVHRKPEVTPPRSEGAGSPEKPAAAAPSAPLDSLAGFEELMALVEPEEKPAGAADPIREQEDGAQPPPAESFSFTPLEEEDIAAVRSGTAPQPAEPQATLEQEIDADPFETYVPDMDLPGVSDLEVSLPIEELSASEEILELPPDILEPASEPLPVDPADEVVPAEAFLATPKPPGPLQIETLGQTIVLYQPDPMLRVAARRAFTRKGFEFLQFGSLPDAREAVGELLDRETFFVTYLDLAGTAAGSDSPELLLGTIKKKDGRLPVVMIDREADLRRRHDLLGMGADFYLTKPSPAHLQPGLAEETLGLFADELMMFAERAFAVHRRATGVEAGELGWAMAGAAEKERSDRGFHLLKRLISELTNPDDLGQITETVMRMAREYFERAVLFSVGGEEIEGLAGFGASGEPEEIAQRARRITIARSEPSVLGDVVAAKTLHRGKLRRCAANEELLRSLGRLLPTEVAVLPIASRERVVGLLYGDNGATRSPLQDVSGLAIFLSQAGLAFETALIARARRGTPGIAP